MRSVFGRASAVAALLAVLLLVAPAGSAPPLAPPTASELSAHVHALAAPAMEGRGSATPGGERAARYIEEALARLGLRPGGDDGTFRQSFAIDSVPRAGAGAALERVAPAAMRFAPGSQWQPHGGSPTGEVSGEVVRVGHGVSAPGHDDYSGVDVRGRIALATDGAPPGLAGERVSRLEKLIAARQHGAIALLLATDALPAPDATATPFELPSASIGRDAVAALGPGATVRLRVELARNERRAANLIALLPGTDPALAGEALVLGAHYDHLGSDGDRIYAGADDNASGTALVLALARALAASGGLPRTVVLVLFSGEELGLLGSRHYAAHPAVPMARTAAMLNFDMVGRLGGGPLRLGGVASGSGLREAVEEAARALPAPRLALDVQPNPHGPSDHASFYAAGVPVLFFHTGSHADYHEPSDTAEKIDADGIARISALALGLVERLGGAPRPAYVQLSPPAPRGRPAAPAAGRAFLGVTASGRGGDGVRVGGVLPGTAADRAGLRGGDVLVRVSDAAVESFADLRRAIGERRPGDLVRLVYLRDGRDHTAEATLGVQP